MPGYISAILGWALLLGFMLGLLQSG